MALSDIVNKAAFVRRPIDCYKYALTVLLVTKPLPLKHRAVCKLNGTPTLTLQLFLGLPLEVLVQVLQVLCLQEKSSRLKTD